MRPTLASQIPRDPLDRPWHRCTVCGWRYLYAPPEDHTICRQCATHFAYDDWLVSHRRLRREWQRRGRRWFDGLVPTPLGWPQAAYIAGAARQARQGKRRRGSNGWR